MVGLKVNNDKITLEELYKNYIVNNNEEKYDVNWNKVRKCVNEMIMKPDIFTVEYYSIENLVN